MADNVKNRVDDEGLDLLKDVKRLSIRDSCLE